ncbi:MAG: NAD-dependent epimerase/dehydratase family protein [Chitinophagales bacterium]
MLQTILGAGGAIGIPLAKELKKYTNDIRLVSRNPKRVNDSDQLYPIDVHNLSQIDKAIEGSGVVYVTIGFEYKLSVWQKTWPAFMQAVIDACLKHNSKLVFFDNVYMYDKEAIPLMTEESPHNPPSKKGAVRKQIHDMIFEAVEKRKLTALIARAADFYGPDNNNSAMTQMVIMNLEKGKKAQTFGNVNKIHTYTYTPDAGKATALLGNTPDAYNQVWHLPTTKERLTNKQWIELIAKEMKAEAKIQVVSNWMIKLLGLFIPMMKEFPEMIYQFEQDYIFDSSKFEKRFNMFATKPEEGVKEMITLMKR